MLRLLALELAIPLRPWPELGILGKGEVVSVRETLKAFRLAHLVEGSFSSASSILAQLAKGQKDNATHQAPANIHWAQDKQTVFFGGRPVSGQQTVARALYREAKDDEDMFGMMRQLQQNCVFFHADIQQAGAQHLRANHATLDNCGQGNEVAVPAGRVPPVARAHHASTPRSYS